MSREEGVSGSFLLLVRERMMVRLPSRSREWSRAVSRKLSRAFFRLKESMPRASLRFLRHELVGNAAFRYGPLVQSRQNKVFLRAEVDFHPAQGIQCRVGLPSVFDAQRLKAFHQELEGRLRSGEGGGALLKAYEAGKGRNGAFPWASVSGP